ncbi:HAMP domain-containing histidine kinase [Ramlibacter humi]|uniref:histidine kinase n=2 Tax=Ramlibacter humi TaxID=2530451 RepID=A0A4Z0CF18_9BURK|nr:HAMP domain-containing histidine kinase [Ramlibacter humi]
MLSASVLLLAEWQYRDFYRSLPQQVKRDVDAMRQGEADPTEEAGRLATIYSQYWRSDPLFGERWSLVIGLVICLPVGLLMGFRISRAVTRPLASIAEAANSIALGDLSVRAKAGSERGELAEMVRDFNRMTDALQALEGERRHTAAALSHELRTPLSVLTARLHALRDGVIDPGPAEFTRLIGEVNHLSRLVEDMHTLALAESRKLSIKPADVALADLAREVLDTFEERAQAFGIELKLLVHDAVIAHGDRDRLRQVLSNLLDNALRHARGATTVQVEVARDGGHAVLSVADDGAGLPERVRRHPFDRFQGSGTTGGSSGLGLSIVQALVSLQGGTVQAEAVEPHGARFVVRLPGGFQQA